MKWTLNVNFFFRKIKTACGWVRTAIVNSAVIVVVNGIMNAQYVHNAATHICLTFKNTWECFSPFSYCIILFYDCVFVFARRINFSLSQFLCKLLALFHTFFLYIIRLLILNIHAQSAMWQITLCFHKIYAWKTLARFS